MLQIKSADTDRAERKLIVARYEKTEKTETEQASEVSDPYYDKNVPKPDYETGTEPYQP